MSADPTVTLIHEFGHQQQFRYLDIAMRDAGKAWTDVVRDDGFGLIPDTSNWTETQALRYAIPKLTSTQYGRRSRSEGFAEGVAERAIGISSPRTRPGVRPVVRLHGDDGAVPRRRLWESRSFDELTAAEKDQFWQTNGAYLDLPGMRDHYPDSAAAYDAWAAGKPQPAPTPGQPPEYQIPAADWDEDVAAQMATSPHDFEGLTIIDEGGRHGKILHVSDDGTQVTVQYKPGSAVTFTPEAGKHKIVLPDDGPAEQMLLDDRAASEDLLDRKRQAADQLTAQIAELEQSGGSPAESTR